MTLCIGGLSFGFYFASKNHFSIQCQRLGDLTSSQSCWVGNSNLIFLACVVNQTSAICLFGDTSVICLSGEASVICLSRDQKRSKIDACPVELSMRKQSLDSVIIISVLICSLGVYFGKSGSLKSLFMLHFLIQGTVYLVLRHILM